MNTLTRRELNLALLALAACAARRTEPLGPDAFRPAERVRVELGGRSYTGTVLEVRSDALRIALEPPDTGELLVRFEDLRSITLLRGDAEVVRLVASEPRMSAGASALLVLGALSLLALVVFAVALAMKTSCPFAYRLDRRTGRRVLAGECYSGAVVKSLARSDLLRLPDAEPGPVSLVLANEAPEIQYTDAAWLEVVDHDPATRVLATHDAALVEVGAPVAANRVLDLEGADQTARVAPGNPRGWATDLFEVCRRDEVASSEGLEARFDAAPTDAALEIVAQNSPWLDRVSLEAWVALGARRHRVFRQGRDPESAARATELLRDAGIHTRVEVRSPGGAWRTVAWVPPPGWVAPRRFAVPLGDVVAGEPLEVRLTSGIGFLLVRELALVPTLGRPEASVVAARSATASWGPDERAKLAAVDGDYDALELMGREVALDFDLPPEPEGRSRAVFLRTHGFYEVHPPDGLVADRSVLRGLRHPEQLGVVGVELFRREVDERIRELRAAA